MIYITTGTTQYGFQRLFIHLEQVLKKIKSSEKVVIQAYYTNWQPSLNNIQLVKKVSYQDNISYFKKSRLTICHGGISSIVLAVSHCQNKAIVVPRYSKYQEHINDHQVDFCRQIKKLYPVELLLDSQNFNQNLERIIVNPKVNPYKNKNNPPNQKVIKLLNSFCSQLTAN